MPVPSHIQQLIEAQAAQNPRRLVKIVDYLLVTTDDHGGRTPAAWEGPSFVASDVQIERLEPDFAERLLRATELRGENWDPAPGPHVVHAFVRRAWQESDGSVVDNVFHWDQNGRLFECLALSRLVRDNATSCEHAVRRMVLANDSDRLVPFSAFDSHVAYRLHPDLPGWLDTAEAEQLRVLVEAYDEGAYPSRARSGLRRAESVVRERFLEDALPLCVGGVEAMLKVGRSFARAQFVQRASTVAGELDTGLSSVQCEALYDDRSALVHGGTVDLSVAGDLSDFARDFVALQMTVRALIRRAIEDAAFGAVFADDAAIAARWPVTVTKGGNAVVL